MWSIFLRFGISALILVVGVWCLQPESLFDMPRRRTTLWMLVLILYPLLSAYPQELIYRRYFFFRYKLLFPEEKLLVIASAMAFGWVHIIFQNWISIALTVVGGWFFAGTYRRTGSLYLTWVEHALFGDLIFTIGLGQYFFHGAIHG